MKWLQSTCCQSSLIDEGLTLVSYVFSMNLQSKIPSVWCSFHENAANVAMQVLQPVLEEVDMPNWIHKIELLSLSLGSKPPLVGRVETLSSKDWSGEQCCFRCCLAGDMCAALNVHVCVPFTHNIYIAIPVTVADIAIDAQIWLGLERSRGNHQVRAVHWALLGIPKVSSKSRIWKTLPANAAPGISLLIKRVMTKDVPAAFLFPKTRQMHVPGYSEGKQTI